VNVITLSDREFKKHENINTCLKYGLVIHLDLYYEHWKIRMHKLIDTRPILQNKTGIEIKELYDERQLIYQNRDIHIMTDNLTEKEVTEIVINKLKLHHKK